MLTNTLPDGLPPRRIYAIGDVHGHLDRLQSIHALIKADLKAAPSPALIVHLGDAVDRGPDPAGCLELLSRGTPVRGALTCNLLGNHEQMLLDALDGQPGAAKHWLRNGGDATLESWGIDPRSPDATWLERVPPHHLELLRNLQPFHVEGRYCLVHAGVRPGIRLVNQSLADLLWIREEFLLWTGTMLPEAPQLRIVHGHTPCPAPDLRPNRLGIDTGAGHGGTLTCAVLESDSVYFLQV